MTTKEFKSLKNGDKVQEMVKGSPFYLQVFTFREFYNDDSMLIESPNGALYVRTKHKAKKL